MLTLEELDVAIRSDFVTLKTLKIPLIEARVMYSTLLKNMSVVFLACFGPAFLLLFLKGPLAMLLGVSGSLHTDDWFSYGYFSFMIFFFSLWLFSYVSPFSLFQIAIRDKLKTGPYLEKKLLKVAKVLCGLFLSVLVLLNIVLLYNGLFSFSGGAIMVAFFLTFLLGNLYLTLEMERLGLTVLVNWISDYYEKKYTPSRQSIR